MDKKVRTKIRVDINFILMFITKKICALHQYVFLSILFIRSTCEWVLLITSPIYNKTF